MNTQHMSVDNLASKLKCLGFQEYQAKAYAGLAIFGVKKAFELSKLTNIPVTKIYSVLSSLENLGLIQSTRDRPKKYFIKDFENSLISFIQKRREKLIEEEKYFTEIIKNFNNKNDDSVKHMESIKVISFDLDGCLSDNSFDELLWRREIPKRYAETFKISFEKAFEYVTSEYKKLYGKTLLWRDPTFWLEYFKIGIDFEELIKPIKREIKIYPDVKFVLKKLHKNYKLIIVTHADRKLLDLKIEKSNLEKFFTRTFSMPTDFGSMNKNGEIMKKVCEIMSVAPSEMIHIGDDYEFDYLAPTSVGIRSFLIDRSGKRDESYVIRNLYEIFNFLENI